MTVFSSVFSSYHTVPAALDHPLRGGAGAVLAAVLRWRNTDRAAPASWILGRMSSERRNIFSRRCACAVDLPDADRLGRRSPGDDYVHAVGRNVISVRLVASHLHRGRRRRPVCDVRLRDHCQRGAATLSHPFHDIWRQSDRGQDFADAHDARGLPFAFLSCEIAPAADGTLYGPGDHHAQ